MRALLWVIALFALAAGLIVGMRYSIGYVLMVVPPYRVELSVNLLLILLLAGFAGAYLLLRAVFIALQVPARVRDLRVARRRRRAQETLIEALKEFFSGRYARAEKAAASAIDLGEQASLGIVIAARAAHELRAYDRRDGYLGRAMANDPAKIVTEAELLLDQHRPQEALDVLRTLPQKHTAALRLELRAQQLARNWDQVLALIEQLEQRKAFDREQASHLRRAALSENLKSRALDGEALETAWHQVPAAWKRDNRLAATAARCFTAAGDCAQARRIVEGSVEESWDSELMEVYADCAGDETVRRIERAEGWLKSHPDDAGLLLTLGKLCTREGLWGKAQSYLEASLSIRPDYSAYLALAGLEERLGKADAACGHYRKSLESAISELKAAADDRRTPRP